MSWYVVADFFEVKGGTITRLISDKVLPALKTLCEGYGLPEQISEIKLSDGVKTEIKTMITEKDDSKIEFFNQKSFETYLDVVKEEYKMKALEYFRKSEAVNLIEYMKLSDEEKENVDSSITDAREDVEYLEGKIHCLTSVLGIFEMLEFNHSGSICMAVSFDY